MGIREDNKRITRERILKSTKWLLLNNGFVKVSTKDISKVSDVAQGSIFLHFGTKDNLLHHIISSDLSLLQNEIEDRVDPKKSRESFLGDFLDVLAIHENILSRIYKDIAYLSDNIKKTVDQIEVLLKNRLFDNIRNHPSKPLSIVDSFINIDAFMAQVRIYLMEKEVFTDYNGILKQRRGKLVKLYRTLFE